jgi:agmatinase
MAAQSNKAPENWFYNSQNFGGLPPAPSGVDSARIVILPIPYETSTTYRTGCRQGPAAIIEASTNMELYDEELHFEPHTAGIATLNPLEPADASEEMINRIEITAAALMEEGKFVVALGGEHSITVGMARAMNRMHKNLSVLFFDAHADFRDRYHGNKFNHGCVARRISEFCRISQIGIRSLSKEEAVELQKRKLEPLWAHTFRSKRQQGGVQDIIDRVVEELSGNVYISIDADVFDPSIMPAVGTPEPGGLLWDEVLGVLKTVCEKRKIVGMDLVELAPVPGLVHPEFLAARLLYKCFGYIFKNDLQH